jgi:MFS family permease
LIDQRPEPRWIFARFHHNGAAFERDLLSAATQTVGWMIVFFVASPAASAAYLTVSETFPLEIRALTIAIFYAIGTGLGGVAAPLVFGKLIESGSRQSIFGGYVFAAVLMFAAAIVAARYAVNAERKPTGCDPPLGSDLKAAICAGSLMSAV